MHPRRGDAKCVTEILWGDKNKEVRGGDKVENCCQQMSYFKVKMHQIRFRLLPQTP